MNRKETAERIKVMQAFVDGKTVQHFEGGKWHDASSPMWSNSCTYRIKPEHREWKFAIRKIDGHPFLYEDWFNLEGYELVTLREVME